MLGFIMPQQQILSNKVTTWVLKNTFLITCSKKKSSTDWPQTSLCGWGCRPWAALPCLHLIIELHVYAVTPRFLFSAGVIIQALCLLDEHLPTELYPWSSHYFFILGNCSVYRKEIMCFVHYFFVVSLGRYICQPDFLNLKLLPF